MALPLLVQIALLVAKAGNMSAGYSEQALKQAEQIRKREFDMQKQREQTSKQSLESLYPGGLEAGFSAGLEPGFQSGIQNRQYGGSVKPKNPYLVGEDGPEVFMPTQEGTVIPNQQNMTYPIQSIPKENYQHMQLLPNQQSNQSQPDNTINTLQSLLSLANQGKQQYLTPELNQPYLGLQGAPPSGNVMRDLGTLAAAINPKSFGGRLGAGMAGNVGEYEQDAARNLAARVGLGRYGMEQQDYQRKLSMQDALDKSKAGIMGRLNQPGGYEDYDQGMSVPTPSPIEGMWKEDPFKAAAFQMEAQSNAPNFAPFVRSDRSNLNSLLSHFTPASVYEYSKTGDMSALQREVSSKEFNMPASLDEILPPIVAKHGIDMSTSQGRVAGYQLYAQNPQVQKEYQREKDRQRLIAPSSNIFIGTNPETGNPLIMPSRGTPNLREVPSPSGGIAPKNLSEDYKKDKTAISQAKDLVGQLRGAWDTLAITTRQSAVQSAVKGKVGLSPDAKLYMDAKSAFLGNLSRSLAAERGVLTQQDIERIDKALASVSLNPISADSQAEALKKWKMVENIINSAEKRMAERNLMTYKNPTGTSGTKLPEGFKSGW